MIRWSTAMFGIVFLSSCTYPPKLYPIPESSPAGDIPFARMWRAAGAFAAETGFAVESINNAAGLITTKRMRVSAEDQQRWFDCGQNALHKPWTQIVPITSTFRILVQPSQDGGSTVRAFLTPEYFGEMKVKGCTSTGVGEREFTEAIILRARRQ